MRNRFDYLAKQIGQEALRPSGTTVAHDEINAETQYADLRHEPDPACQAERNRIGLLGRLASEPCLIEVYSHAPDAEEFRACLAKHLASWQGRARKARSDNRKRSEQGQPSDVFLDSFLWIIAAGSPTMLLTKLELKAAPDWPVGVYLFGGDVLRVGLVVASELPREATTLLVRLMAAGPLLAQAVEDVAALPLNAHERAVAEPILLAFKRELALQPSRTAEEQEFIVAILLRSWEDARTVGHAAGLAAGLAEGRVEGLAEGRVEGLAEGRVEGLAEGRVEGLAEGQANAVLAVLRVRGIAVSDAERTRILEQKDLACLERWHERAITAASIAEVLDGAS